MEKGTRGQGLDSLFDVFVLPSAEKGMELSAKDRTLAGNLNGRGCQGLNKRTDGTIGQCRAKSSEYLGKVENKTEYTFFNQTVPVCNCSTTMWEDPWGGSLSVASPFPSSFAPIPIESGNPSNPVAAVSTRPSSVTYN